MITRNAFPIGDSEARAVFAAYSGLWAAIVSLDDARPETIIALRAHIRAYIAKLRDDPATPTINASNAFLRAYDAYLSELVNGHR